MSGEYFERHWWLPVSDTLQRIAFFRGGSGTVLLGIEMGYILQPVHRIHIKSKLITGFLPVVVCAALPVSGRTLLMGNDMAGGKVTPELEVLDFPQSAESGKVP